MHRTAFGLATAGIATAMLLYGLSTAAVEPPATSPVPADLRTFVESHCLDCHAGSDPSGDLDLEPALADRIGSHADVWERVVRKLNARQMPPPDMPRPDESEYTAILNTVTGTLDRQAAEHPQPGRTETFRRLTRFEYRNAIRDLL
ncbi:MAG: c-type cytochrome domain-containing protein, partial [Maioricimonas sp. JB045]